MLIALHYCRKDHQQAARLAAWLDELGPFPGHHFLIASDKNADPDVFLGRKNLVCTHIVIRDDTTDKWPESANHAFKRIGKHIQHSIGAQAFFYLEPDCVILRTSAFDEIEAEYQRALAAGKHFVGQLIDQRKQGIDSPPHCSGIAVYPANLVEHAGIIYQADNVPFDIVAGPTIVPQMAQSDLILHNWKAAPFESWADVERRIFAVRPKCAVYHSDKSGALLGLLRERKNFSGVGERLAGAKPDSQRRPEVGAESHPPACELSEGDGHSHLITSELSASPAENPLPVPSLADTTPMGQTPSPENEVVSEARASETESQSPNPADLQGQADARGGQFISEPDSAAEPVPLGGKGAHGIECTCLKRDFPCPFHFRDYEHAELPAEIKTEHPLTLLDSTDGPPLLIAKDQLWFEYDAIQQKIINVWEWDGAKWVKASWPRATDNYTLKFTVADPAQQPPWASKPDSIAEIRQLAARLMQFSDSSPHVRLVRAELHDAGVIRLTYRYKKRRGWKRKKR